MHNTYNETVVHLEAGDETYQPINDPSSLVKWFDDDGVFQIPHDTDEATVVIEPSYKNGPSSKSKVLEFDTIKAELALD